MGKPSFRWESEPEKTFTTGYKKYGQDAVNELRFITMYYQSIVESWMKTNAKWTDRSANARQGLYAEVEELVMGAVLILDHRMEYGVFLELGMSGQYAIIKPALDKFAPEIWAEVKRRFS